MTAPAGTARGGPTVPVANVPVIAIVRIARAVGIDIDEWDASTEYTLLAVSSRLRLIDDALALLNYFKGL